MSLMDHTFGSLPSPLPRLNDPSSLLDSFAAAYHQSNRLLKVHLSADSVIPENLLLPHRLTGHEGINQGFRYELECLSSNTYFELKSFLGIPIEVAIFIDTGGERSICGLVTAAHQEGADGGFANFRLTIESGLDVLRERINARVWMDIDVLDLTKRILADHLSGNEVLKASLAVDYRCTKNYASRPFWMQFNETDLDYLKRIWARDGISYVVEPSKNSTHDHPQHVLVLFDDEYTLDVNESQTMRFHRSDGTESSDAITEWRGQRKLQAGSTTRMAWDYTSASINQASEDNQVDQGDGANDLASTLEKYQHHRPLDGEDPETLPSLATRRMKAIEGLAKNFEALGSVRSASAGTWFTLTQHPIHDQDDPQDRDFLVTSLEVEAENNLPKDLEGGLGGLLRRDPMVPRSCVPYANRFTCVRRGIPVLPDQIPSLHPGMMTARVVGPSGSVVHTDPLGRIKVQFLFARDADHPEAGASNTDADSAWVRQAETWGSHGFGGAFLPRVGDEVVIDFLGGDPDKPIVSGSAHNRAKLPTSFSDVSALPNEKALSGIRSQMHHGSGGNELILDDTTNQIRTRLASDHEVTHLNLGYLVHPRSGGSGTPRGEGFELRTDARGAVRAQKGLLFTLFQTTGPHLEADPFTSQMESSLELASALSETGEQVGAEKLEANDALKKLKESAQAKHHQGHGRAVNDVPAFMAPVLGLASPDGTLSATPASHILSANGNVHITSGEDTSIGVGKKLVMAIKESWSAFVSKHGIKLFAGKENFDIQAHDGNVQILADQSVKLISATDELKVSAKRYIKVTAGRCQIELTDKDVNLYMAGPINIHSNLNFGGAQTEPPQFPRLPKLVLNGVYDDQFQVLDEDTGKPIPDLNYRIEVEEGRVIRGVTDSDGCTLRVTDNNPKTMKLFIEDGVYDEQFVVIDEKTDEPMPGVPYRIEVEDGSVIHGKTDAKGRTHRVNTGPTPLEMKLYIENHNK
jgi:type VI secretion system secreted protein VgrG